MNLLLSYAQSFIGSPYRWGGETPLGGFDCSGLVQEILRSVGMDPVGDQTAQTLFNHFLIQGTRSSLGEPGALLFFGSSDRSITHVTMALNEHQMIEAGGGNSSTTSAIRAIEQKAFVRIRPISNRRDLVSVLMPNYPKWVHDGHT